MSNLAKLNNRAAFSDLTPADPKTCDNYCSLDLRIFIVFVMSVLNKEIKLN